MSILVWKRDWESPEGEVVKGEELLIDLYEPTVKEQLGVEGLGFNHLTDGSFLWYKDKEGKVLHLALDSIDSATLLDGISRVEFVHEGGGCFTFSYECSD